LEERAEEIRACAFSKSEVRYTDREAGMVKNMEPGKTHLLRPPLYTNELFILCGQFSTVKGVRVDASDTQSCNSFNTGCIKIPWQREMIETEYLQEPDVFSRDDGNLLTSLGSDCQIQFDRKDDSGNMSVLHQISLVHLLFHSLFQISSPFIITFNCDLFSVFGSYYTDMYTFP
uniref:G protein-coupled receptor kinase n=1 Tax=Angiostrongylus cantonensis TaxID=6313 RepID=A0A0K0CYN9_ANGCA